MPTVLLIGRAGGRISTGRYSLLARASRVPGRVSRRGCVPFTKMDAPSPRHNYVVTALKPTLANACAHAVFTGPSDSNLVVAKASCLEVYRCSSDSMELVTSAPIYGNVHCLLVVRLPGDATDALFLLLEDFRFTMLMWDAARGALVTRACGDLSDRTGRPADEGPIAAVDSAARCIAVHMYSGLVKILPLEKGRGGSDAILSSAVNFRIEELTVIDLAFLDTSGPTAVLAVLSEDLQHARHLRTYAVDLAKKAFNPGPIAHVPNLEGGAHALVPVPRPLGGALVLGEATAHYLASTETQVAQPLPPSARRAWSPVLGGASDSFRALVGSDLGFLHLVAVHTDEGGAPRVRVEELGAIHPPHSLAFLGHGLAFVGSQAADSQLIRIHEEPIDTSGDAAMDGEGAVEGPNFVEVLQEMPHLGPIVDFTVVDVEGHGQGQIIACAGLGPWGSLRVVRSGIGITEQASASLPGIRGVWALPEGPDASTHSRLVVSFVAGTRVLQLQGTEIGEEEASGIDASRQTLAAAGVAHGQAVQVTPAEARLLSLPALSLVSSFAPNPPAPITKAGASDDGAHVALVTGPRHVTVLRVERGSLAVAGERDFSDEVACVSVGRVAGVAVCAVGLWSRMVEVVAVHGMATLATVHAEGDMVPRSVYVGELDNAAGGAGRGKARPGASDRDEERAALLLCALGDGQLLTVPLSLTSGEGQAPALATGPPKRAALGTKPITLTSFAQGGARSVFAACDRPSVVYLSAGKLLFCNVNTGEVTAMCPFHAAAFPNCIVTVSRDDLSIGAIDDIQKLHVRTVPLGEQPRRIAYDAATGTLCLGTVTEVPVVRPGADGASGSGQGAADATGAVREVSRVHLLAAGTFERLFSMDLLPNEDVCSLAAAPFSTAPGAPAHYVLGTAIVDPKAEEEPKEGRIVVFSIEDDGTRLEVVASKTVKNAVHAIAPFGDRIVVSVGAKVHVLHLAEGNTGSKELTHECGWSGNTMTLQIDVRGDFILVGDLMRSVSVLLYNRGADGKGALEERAHDYEMGWPTASKTLADDVFLTADAQGNLKVLRMRGEAEADEDRARLEAVGVMSLGAAVNRVHRGSLVMRPPDAELGGGPTLLMGCVSGAVVMMAPLPQQAFDVLWRVQGVMAEVPGVGNLAHGPWRRCEADRRISELSGFIDGDLIEGLLDLPRERQERVAKAAGEDLATVLRLVEELSRMH